MRRWLVFFLMVVRDVCVSQNVVITGVTVYPSPGEKPINHAEVVVANGKILYVGKVPKKDLPADAVTIDGEGLFLTAGFWNCHVHFTEPKWKGADTMTADRLKAQLDDMVNSRGFTHVFDVGELDFDNLKALRARIDKGEIPGPSIRAVGVPLVPVNGSPFYILPAKLPEIGEPATAVRQVLTQVKAGAQGIKLFVASSNGKEVVPMNPASASAAVKTAHEYHLPVFAHPSTDAGVTIAVSAGVDVLAHVAPDAHRPWNAALVNSLIQKNIAVTPTLRMFQWSLMSNGGDTTKDELMPTALQQLSAFRKAGGTILFGTDVGYMTDYNTQGEFEFMDRAGLTFSDILKSLTTAPAKKFGFEKSTGRVAPGYDADLVLLSADPAVDSKNFSNVAYSIVRGKVVFRR